MPPIYPGSKDRHPFLAATGHIFALSPETRTMLPKNGIRWNIIPADNLSERTESVQTQYSTWPIFVDDHDRPIDGFLETERDYRTYLYSFVPESRANWMVVGASFFFVEGARRVGAGRIKDRLF